MAHSLEYATQEFTPCCERKVRLLEDAVRLDEVLDDFGMVTIDPACENRQEQLKWEQMGPVAWIIGSKHPWRKPRDHSAI